MPRLWLLILLHRIDPSLKDTQLEEFHRSIQDQQIFQQQVFILRRSAGFAGSFLALLRAEPLNCAPTLLPLAMKTLIETASRGINIESTKITDSDESWKTAVHALNVLRLLFIDGSLSSDITLYVPQVLAISVAGFTSSHWAVRNSSMMVFTSAAQRAVGIRKLFIKYYSRMHVSS